MTLQISKKNRERKKAEITYTTKHKNQNQKAGQDVVGKKQHRGKFQDAF